MTEGEDSYEGFPLGEIISLYQRMDGSFALWAVRAALHPIYTTTRLLHNFFHYEIRKCIETHPSCHRLARPTPKGLAAAKFYCERTGLKS